MLSLFLWCLERMYSILVSPSHTYGAFMVEGTAESIPLGDVDSFPSAVRVNIGANDPDMTVPFTGERSIRDCYYSLQLLDMSDTNPFSKDVVEYKRQAGQIGEWKSDVLSEQYSDSCAKGPPADRSNEPVPYARSQESRLCCS